MKGQVPAEIGASEEIAFFTNVLTVITIIVGLVTLISTLTLNIDSALNGSNPVTLTQVQLSCLFNHAITQYILIFVGILLLASILRYASSLKWKKFKLSLKKVNWLLIASWIVLIIAVIYGLWLISVYTCSLT
jgi:flagellar biosynthesis protein FlhB